MTLRYWCNALSTELSSHMDSWSIVSSSYCARNRMLGVSDIKIRSQMCYAMQSALIMQLCSFWWEFLIYNILSKFVLFTNSDFNKLRYDFSFLKSEYEHEQVSAFIF